MMHQRYFPLLLLLFFLPACDIVGNTPGTPTEEGRPTIVDFSATPVDTQGQATLSWRVSDATSLSLDQGIGEVTGESVVVSPAQSTTYTLTATNDQGSSRAQATVTVGDSPPPTPGEDATAPTGSFGVSPSADPPFQNDSGGNISDADDSRVVRVQPGGSFYMQVAYDDPSGLTNVEVNLVNSSPPGVRGPLDPSQQFFTLVDPETGQGGSCDLSGTPTSVTCVYEVQVAEDAVNISELDGAGSEFAYVFRTKVTDAAGNTSDEAIRGYVVVTEDDTQEPNNPENRAPTAEFTAEQQADSLTVQFSAQASSDPDGDPLSYNWDFGDGGGGSSRDFRRTYREAGDYEVILTVSDSGKEDTAVKTVTVEAAGDPEPEPQECSNPVQIPDDVLRGAIREELGKPGGDLTCEDLASLTELSWGGNILLGESIDDLEGLQYAVNLESLILGPVAPGSYEHLSGLTRLTQLQLLESDIEDLAFLAPLTNLVALNLSTFLDPSKFEDLTPLANLTKLQKLDLSVGNTADGDELGMVKDIRPLQGLANLTELILWQQPVEDLAPLVENPGLDEGDIVALGDNGCPDADYLANVDTLRERGVRVSLNFRYCEELRVTTTSGAASLEDECTLRAAITAANTDEAVGGCPAGRGADTIVLAEGATYTLSEVDNGTDQDAGVFGDRGLPIISSEIDVRGNGATIESQENTPTLSLLYIAGEGNLTLQSVTLDGKTDGLVLENQGTVSLIGSTVTTSTDSASLVYNHAAGTLTLQDSNVVDSPYTGIANEGTLKLERSRVENNGAPLDVNNGGIANSGGNVTLIDSIIRGNVGEATGGISNFGETIQGDDSRAVLEITRSVISDNYSAESGSGALFNFKGEVTIRNSTFSNNTARVEDIGPHTLENASGATMSITNSTIVVENAPGLDDDNRPPYPAVVNRGTLLLQGTIIDGDDERQISCANEAPITSQGYNLDSDGSCGLSQDTDLSNVEPQLGELQANGGPTRTHALQAGSPALDAIPADACEVETDQRGVSRPQGEACDIGAFERE